MDIVNFGILVDLLKADLKILQKERIIEILFLLSNYNFNSDIETISGYSEGFFTLDYKFLISIYL